MTRANCYRFGVWIHAPGYPPGWHYAFTTETSYTWTGGIACGTTYDINVAARGDGITYAAKWSLERWGKVTTPRPDPPAPSGFSGSATGTHSISASWDRVHDTTKYEFGIEVASLGGWQTKELSRGTTSTTWSTGLAPGRTYKIRVRVHGDGGVWAAKWSDYSEAEVTTDETPPPPPSLPTPPAPSNVSASIIVGTGANTYGVELVWDLLSGAASFKVERSDDNGVTWPQPGDAGYDGHVTTGITGTQHSVTGLACDNDYVFRISALGDGSRYRAVYGPTRLVTRYVPFGQRSASSDVDNFPCTRPTVEVIPMPGRMAKIEWEYRSGSTFDVGYGPIQDDGTINWGRDFKENSSDTSFTIANLDGALGGGFAQGKGIGFRVKARFGGQETDYTEIILIDTPIVRALGSGAGRVSLTWTDIDTVLGGNGLYTVGAYSARVRKFGNSSAGLPHTSKDWIPDNFVDSNGMPDEYGEKVHIDANNGVITGLETEQIYAIQLIASVTKRGSAIPTAVFAVRDMYVWPSDSAATRGKRVGSFPMNPWIRNYRYRICKDTFASLHDDPDKWVAHINHAFRQWELATGGWVRAVHEVDSNGDSVPCTDYSAFVDEIEATVNREIIDVDPAIRPSPDEIRTSISGLLVRLKEKGLDPNAVPKTLQDAQQQDNAASEVMMINDAGGPVYTFESVILGKSSITKKEISLFSEIASEIGYADCSAGCTVDFPRDKNSSDPRTSDIFLRRTVHGLDNGNPRALIDLTGVDRIVFNTCPNTTDKYNYPYSSLVHEAGHALGIGGAKDADGQVNHHPNEDIHSSIMSYGGNQPKCSPHPWDIMAIFALYPTPP